MEELDKWKSVNSCETFDELNESIKIIGDIKYSLGRVKTAQEIQDVLALLRTNVCSVEAMTRNYGLRAKVMYLFHYGEK